MGLLLDRSPAIDLGRRSQFSSECQERVRKGRVSSCRRSASARCRWS